MNFKTIKYHLKVNKEERILLQFLMHISKNIYNYTLYNLNGEVEQVEHKYSNLLMRKNYNPGMAVQVWWKDNNGEDHAMTCNMSQGKLLLPLGAGAKWLFNNHSAISIRTFQDDIEIQTPEISKIRLLKIQEVQ